VGEDKALVKAAHEGKFVVAMNQKIDKSQLKANCRVALKKSTYEIA
jgi:ATP-dependent 26S proteasome regulatory subunit